MPRGVARVRGFGRTPPPPTGRKRSAKSVFFFFFLRGIAQESVIVEKDERTPPTENKSCKTRHGQVGTSPKRRRRQRNQRLAHVQNEAWPGANGKRRPIGRYTAELSINGERPAAQTDKRTAQMPSCSVESC